MFKVLSTMPAEVTRKISLQNIHTGSIDVCFDDSDLFSDKNFDFMKIGEIYDCKISLFGKFDVKGEEFEILEKIELGCKNLLKVRNQNKDIYFISGEIKNFSPNEIMNYDYSRKDLIEVDGILHPFYQHGFWNKVENRDV